MREGGAGLSAGERQLISIARALLADPRILILDEATSNIDRPTEVLIERALDRLLRGRTSIIIAHRLATVAAGRRDRSWSSTAGSCSAAPSASCWRRDGPFRRLARELPRGRPRRTSASPASDAAPSVPDPLPQGGEPSCR